MITPHLSERLATDGRFIVEDVGGIAFWPGQPFIADCGISSMSRPVGDTKAYAEALAGRYNAHLVIVRAARELLRTMPKPIMEPAREAYENLKAVLP